MLAILAPSKDLSFKYTAAGLKIGLSFVPEVIAALALTVGGLVTRDVRSRVVNEGIVVEEGAKNEGRGKWDREGEGKMFSRV